MVRDAHRDRRSDVATPSTPGLGRMLIRACTLRCCVCGQGKLFRRWTQLVDRCPSCGYLFERSEGQYIGAVGINTVVTFGLLLVVLIIGFIVTSPHTPILSLSLIGAAVAVLAPIVLYPFSKTIWTAVDLALSPLEAGEAPQLLDATSAAEHP